MAMKFLTAHWQHLLLANYSIQPEVLKHLVPVGTQIDCFEGHVFVSLVAFMFRQTKVLGLPIPFHRDFEEVNLRFYVRPQGQPQKRAVTFIREIVPRAAIPLIANSFFSENYVALPMSHQASPTQHSYSWTCGTTHTFSGRVTSSLSYPSAGSVGEFITEHYWGYAKGRRGTLEYQVEHPQWQCCEVQDFNIQVDFAQTYGAQYAFLNAQQPHNVLYALGSEVSVSFPKRLQPLSSI